MAEPDSYSEDIRLFRSLLIVTALRDRKDLQVLEALRGFDGGLVWEPLSELMIDDEVWRYAVETMGYDPKLVFCHPEVLLHDPRTSLYYRGMCALSLKAVRDYFGAVDNLERGNRRARLGQDKALKMARTYNTFICSLIKNSADWTLENGRRTIIATLGITLDGVMRNKIGDIAEQRVRILTMEWVLDHGLLVTPQLTRKQIREALPVACELVGGVMMEHSSEPDISFYRDTETGRDLLAIVEIKGGIDPAGALERSGAATKSFQHALEQSARCRNFLLSAVYTPELSRRIASDRLVEHSFDIVRMLEDPLERDRFFQELFHHTLRLI